MAADGPTLTVNAVRAGRKRISEDLGDHLGNGVWFGIEGICVHPGQNQPGRSRCIDLAWEFATEQMGLDPDRIWPTVFAGDPELGLGEDDELAIVLTFGYPARETDASRRSPEEWSGRANRKPLDELVERL